MRALFSDGYNSFYHVLFGALAVRYWIVWPLFVGYQLWQGLGGNTVIDLVEFFVGYGVTLYLFRDYHRKAAIWWTNTSSLLSST